MVLLLLLFSMTAFSYVGLLSLLWVRLFHAVFPEPSSTQLFSWVVVFWAVCRARLRSFVSFFSSGLLFGLPIFSVSVLSSLQSRFHRFSSFFLAWFLCFSLFTGSVDFSCSEGSFSLFFSTEFPCVCYRGFLPSGSVLSSRAALSSENACYWFLCRWHVTATVTGWFHP